MDNILFCSVGRRATLLRYFRESMNGNGKLIATDLSPVAPGLFLRMSLFWFLVLTNQDIMIRYLKFVSRVM